MTQFVKVSINPTDQAYYIGAFGLGWFYMIAYCIEYLSFKNKITKHTVRTWLTQRIVLEVVLIVILLGYPIALQSIFTLTFGRLASDHSEYALAEPDGNDFHTKTHELLHRGQRDERLHVDHQAQQGDRRQQTVLLPRRADQR